MELQIFGKLPANARLERILKSSNYKEGSFRNLRETPMLGEDTNYWKMLRSFFSKPSNTTPSKPLPSVITRLDTLTDDYPVIVWFGHSSYLLRINGLNILVDPVLSGSAAPFSFMVKAYKGANVYSVNDLPPIDILILTHDHFDHADCISLKKMMPGVQQIITSLGVGAHLEYWDFDKNKIIEMDWWDKYVAAPGMEFTAAPARHFSGRGLKRAQTLWSSFILKTPTHTIYIGGDSGYDTHFKNIGDAYGPFDLVILESGQYNKQWPFIHMMPEETVQAAVDLKGKLLLPVHWGKFTLSLHPWNEPIKRILTKANELQVSVTTPMIGEPVLLGNTHPSSIWWNI